ncbi:reverse transcriptase domain-containing protein [Pseudomonas sp. PhalM4]
MNTNGLKRLVKLRELNANHAWVNQDLYRLMYAEDLYITAYERIKSSPGNMTLDAEGKTIDGFSLDTIRNIIKEMRDESFTFTRSRRVQIPKPNGGKRPLSIPSARDKIVQEVMRMIFEAIYDGDNPTFKECSHGFRRGRDTHGCLNQVFMWSATSWFIEGDIKACFDEIPHDKLIAVLKKRISDSRFLDLIWKALKAGYLEFNTPKNSISGTPQGSIVSPILANIFLHELDTFVEGIVERETKGTVKRLNPVYTRYQKVIQRVREGRNIPREVYEEAKRNRRKVPSVLVNDPRVIRVRYVRYADDWLIGIDGPKSLAIDIKEQVREYLRDNLGLTLSDEKTKIGNARTEPAFFLGTYIQIGRSINAEARQSKINITGKRQFRRRGSKMGIIFRLPTELLVRKLHANGFCDGEGNPTPKRAWSILEARDIVTRFNHLLNGYNNYYSFVHNRQGLARLQFILQKSAIMTFAQKYRTRQPDIYRRFGPKLEVVTPGKDGNFDSVALSLINVWNMGQRFSSGGNVKDIARTQLRLRSRTKLEGEVCCVCGKNEGIVMHHVRHVRKGASKGFAKVLSAINRKQIPVCPGCHLKIHNGQYDGMRLADLAEPKIAAR